MTDVKGKWALITGANRGVGYRIAKFMASKGCNLILHSRSLDAQDFAGLSLEEAVKKNCRFSAALQIKIN